MDSIKEFIMQSLRGVWAFTTDIIPFADYIRLLPQYAWVTLQITTLGILTGLVLGLIIALLRISKIKIISYPARVYIWFVRGTPLLLQLWLIYFGLTDIIRLPSYQSAFIALGIHNAAYIAEIFRGSIVSVDRGQKEAAYSLGMTPMQAMARIILPQAVKRSVPPLGNQFIIALKDSSLASTIGVGELFLRTRQFGASDFRMLHALFAAAIYYLIMTTILTVIVGKVEKKFSVSDR